MNPAKSWRSDRVTPASGLPPVKSENFARSSAYFLRVEGALRASHNSTSRSSLCTPRSSAWARGARQGPARPAFPSWAREVAPWRRQMRSLPRRATEHLVHRKRDASDGGGNDRLFGTEVPDVAVAARAGHGVDLDPSAGEVHLSPDVAFL